MTIVPVVIGKYIYAKGDFKGSFQAVDVHHILLQKRSARDILLYFIIILLLVWSLIQLKEKAGVLFLSNTFLGIFFLKAWHGKRIMKESVVILKGFGVQLETHYRSGKVTRRFVPMGNILKPVLNECVTPVTCYWTLSLIMRGETDLTLVFQELRPPAKMLVPVWKALCDATGSYVTPTVVHKQGCSV